MLYSFVADQRMVPPTPAATRSGNNLKTNNRFDLLASTEQLLGQVCYKQNAETRKVTAILKNPNSYAAAAKQNAAPKDARKPMTKKTIKKLAMKLQTPVGPPKEFTKVYMRLRQTRPMQNANYSERVRVSPNL